VHGACHDGEVVAVAGHAPTKLRSILSLFTGSRWRCVSEE
jgi:hypothetical protein